ncbi:uncharacterized protein LOC144996653 [Oryzias latipes]
MEKKMETKKLYKTRGDLASFKDDDVECCFSLQETGENVVESATNLPLPPSRLPSVQTTCSGSSGCTVVCTLVRLVREVRGYLLKLQERETETKEASRSATLGPSGPRCTSQDEALKSSTTSEAQHLPGMDLPNRTN